MKFIKPFEDDIHLFSMTNDQTRCLIASNTKLMFVNIAKKIQKNMTKMVEMTDFKHIIYNAGDDQFYVLANRFNGKLGVYVITINASDYTMIGYVYKQDTNLDIADANLYINNFNQLKELIISYKVIYINTFDILIIDLRLPGYRLVFKHESS